MFLNPSIERNILLPRREHSKGFPSIDLRSATSSLLSLEQLNCTALVQNVKPELNFQNHVAPVPYLCNDVRVLAVFLPFVFRKKSDRTHSLRKENSSRLFFVRLIFAPSSEPTRAHPMTPQRDVSHVSRGYGYIILYLHDDKEKMFHCGILFLWFYCELARSRKMPNAGKIHVPYSTSAAVNRSIRTMLYNSTKKRKTKKKRHRLFEQMQKKSNDMNEVHQNICSCSASTSLCFPFPFPFPPFSNCRQ